MPDPRSYKHITKKKLQCFNDISDGKMNKPLQNISYSVKKNFLYKTINKTNETTTIIEKFCSTFLSFSFIVKKFSSKTKIILKLNKHADESSKKKTCRSNALPSVYESEWTTKKKRKKIWLKSLRLFFLFILLFWFETNPNVNNRLSSIVLRSILNVYLINVTSVNWA